MTDPEDAWLLWKKPPIEPSTHDAFVHGFHAALAARSEPQGAEAFDAAVQRAFAGSGVEVRTSFTPTDPTPPAEGLLEAIRAYGDARADVAYGRATRKAIDHAWDRVLAAGHIPPMDQRDAATPPAEGLDLERLARVIRGMNLAPFAESHGIAETIATRYAAFAPEQPE